jgi:hypothetical protein
MGESVISKRWLAHDGISCHVDETKKAVDKSVCQNEGWRGWQKHIIRGTVNTIARGSRTI